MRSIVGWRIVAAGDTRASRSPAGSLADPTTANPPGNCGCRPNPRTQNCPEERWTRLRRHRLTSAERRVARVAADARTSDSMWSVKRIRERTRRCRSALRPGWRPSSFWHGIRVLGRRREIADSAHADLRRRYQSLWSLATATCAGNAHPVTSLFAKVAFARNGTTGADICICSAKNSTRSTRRRSATPPGVASTLPPGDRASRSSQLLCRPKFSFSFRTHPGGCRRSRAVAPRRSRSVRTEAPAPRRYGRCRHARQPPTSPRHLGDASRRTSPSNATH